MCASARSKGGPLPRIKTPRQLAFEAGAKTYESSPCSAGHTTYNTKSGYCVECASARNKQTRIDNPPLALWRSAKNSSRDKGLEFNLEIEDIIVPEFCPVLGHKLVITDGAAGYGSPSIDRIDRSRGYIKGNVRVISWRANNLRSDGTAQELERVARDQRGLEQRFGLV